MHRSSEGSRAANFKKPMDANTSANQNGIENTEIT